MFLMYLLPAMICFMQMRPFQADSYFLRDIVGAVADVWSVLLMYVSVADMTMLQRALDIFYKRSFCLYERRFRLCKRSFCLYE